MPGKINPNQIRPDKLLFKGLKNLTHMTMAPVNMYADLKSKAKGKAEITFIGEKKLEEVKIQTFLFNEEEISESNEKTFDLLTTKDKSKIGWLNIHGLHEVELIQKMANDLNLDRLTVRHILDTTQRPKVEEYDGYLFFNVRSTISAGPSEDL